MRNTVIDSLFGGRAGWLTQISCLVLEAVGGGGGVLDPDPAIMLTGCAEVGSQARQRRLESRVENVYETRVHPLQQNWLIDDASGRNGTNLGGLSREDRLFIFTRGISVLDTAHSDS